MLVQCAFISESLFTQFTLERLFSCVNFEMGLQIAFSSEFLVTTVTFESFFFRKISFMTFRSEFFLGECEDFVNFNHVGR